MKRRRLMGLETEYAAIPVWGLPERPDGDLIENLFFDAARQTLEHLPDAGGRGMFLVNGSRLYPDVGAHMELAGPACESPEQVVRYGLAGDQIVNVVCARVVSESPMLSELFATKACVDYQGSTWGSHESYMHYGHPSDLHEQLVPHLATRIVYTGAGGWCPNSASLRFTLSPRVSYLEHAISGGSTGGRGIIHLKDEPLGPRDAHRLHLVCGEGLCGQLGQYLRFGTTALLVAAIEDGKLRPAEHLRLAAPLDAMRRFAADPSLQARAQVADSTEHLTALEIQRAYVAALEANWSDAWAPDWGAALLRTWHETLDRLAQGPAAVATRLDWAMKYALYNSLLDEESPVPRANMPAAEFVARQNSDGLVNGLFDSWLQLHGLTRDSVAAFVAFKDRLMQIDMSFGRVDTRGVFHGLERSGVLHPALVSRAEVLKAMREPPGQGREALRSKWVKTIAAQGRGGRRPRGFATWDAVVDAANKRMLTLHDPFGAEERWAAFEQDEAGSARRGRAAADRLSWILGRREAAAGMPF